MLNGDDVHASVFAGQDRVRSCGSQAPCDAQVRSMDSDRPLSPSLRPFDKRQRRIAATNFTEFYHYAPCSIPAARRPAAFQPARRAMPRTAAAEESAAPAPAAKRAPRTKREVTVDLKTVSPGDEFDGSVVSC
eukprot:363869-Chlamydomonas_euryale.AAC.39